mgnify:CR=1 FL=1
MSKSKLQLAWEEFKFSDPGWYATVIPVAGCAGRVALCAARDDPYFPGRKMYGSVFAEYQRHNDAEKAAKILNESRKANT